MHDIISFHKYGNLLFIFLYVNHRIAGESLHFLFLYDTINIQDDNVDIRISNDNLLYFRIWVFVTNQLNTFSNCSYQSKRGRRHKEQVVATYLFFALKYGIMCTSSIKEWLYYSRITIKECSSIFPT